MTVESRLDQLLDSTQAYANVEDAIAADRIKALADANSGHAFMPPHEQLCLDPYAQARYDQMLEESYEQCRKITAHYAKTFYFGTEFFDEPKRKAVWAVYAWCRRTDDIVDKPRKDTTSLRDELADWTERLRLIWQGIAYDSIDLALVDTVRNYPGLTVQPFEDMVKGMVMDLDQNRFDTFDELYVYCYRVAGTVGLMVLPIMGTAEDATLEEALEPALALGVALQLTNILRDVGEDRARQRIYLPREDLVRFGVTEQALLKGVKDENYTNMLKFQIARAREWYMRAEAGIPMLAEDAQLPVRQQGHKVAWRAAAHAAAHRSRSSPACSGLPPGPERRALVAWRLKSGGGGALVPAHWPRVADLAEPRSSRCAPRSTCTRSSWKRSRRTTTTTSTCGPTRPSGKSC